MITNRLYVMTRTIATGLYYIATRCTATLLYYRYTPITNVSLAAALTPAHCSASISALPHVIPCTPPARPVTALAQRPDRLADTPAIPHLSHKPEGAGQLPSSHTACFQAKEGQR